MLGRCIYALLALISIVMLLVTAALHGLSWYEYGTEKDIFVRTMSTSWGKDSIPVVRANWLFFVWAAIYAYQLIWLVYILTVPCQSTKNGWLGAQPPLMPPSILVFFILSLGSMIAYVFLWNRFIEHELFAMLCLTGSALLSSGGLAISLYAVKIHGLEVLEQGEEGALWLVQLFVQNGLAAFGSWAMICSFYIIDITLTNSGISGSDQTGYTSLACTMAYVLVWLFLDLVVARDIIHFIITPYIIALVVFVLSVVANSPKGQLLLALSIVFSVISLALVVLKLASTLARTCQSRETTLDEDSFGAVSYEENHGSDTMDEADLKAVA